MMGCRIGYVTDFDVSTRRCNSDLEQVLRAVQLDHGS